MKDFRRIDRKEYPELSGCTDSRIYKDFIGCGGLYLATKMIRKLNLKSGGIVLDLGCGKGETSVYLAKKLNVTVVAVDFWNSPEEIAKKASEEGLSDKIIPLKLDITQCIPFSENYFDAIFCMNSLFMFGGEIEFLKRLLGILKPGGTICIGSECFNKEPDFSGQKGIPDAYRFDWHWKVWEECYSKYHAPAWWRRLLSDTGLLNITCCEELTDGRVMFEDFVCNFDQYINQDIISSGAVIPKSKFAEQIMYGFEHELYPTVYIMTGIKKEISNMEEL